MPRRKAIRGRDESRPYHPVLGQALAEAARARTRTPGGSPAATGAVLADRAPAASAPASATPAEDERRFFERALAGVRPLPRGPERLPLPSPSRAAHPRPARSPHSETAEFTVERRDGNVTGARFGVSHETLRYLARGEFLAEARCDLHGLRAAAAAQRLRSFVEESVARGRKAVLVVCGRGLHSGPDGPVLLDVASDVLARSPTSRHVQAFASATPARGGEGALMVLLRRAPGSEER